MIRTAATRAAEINRIVAASSPFARTRTRTDRIANQKNVRIGSRIMYSMM